MAPAEALAADPLPDSVAVMQLAVAASAHRAGGVKVGGDGWEKEWWWWGGGSGWKGETGRAKEGPAGSGGPRSVAGEGPAGAPALPPRPSSHPLCLPFPPQLPEGAVRLAIFIDGTESDADLVRAGAAAAAAAGWLLCGGSCVAACARQMCLLPPSQAAAALQCCGFGWAVAPASLNPASPCCPAPCAYVQATLKDMGAVLALLKTAPGLSRVHASRRVFEALQTQQVGGVGAGGCPLSGVRVLA